MLPAQSPVSVPPPSQITATGITAEQIWRAASILCNSHLWSAEARQGAYCGALRGCGQPFSYDMTLADTVTQLETFINNHPALKAAIEAYDNFMETLSLKLSFSLNDTAQLCNKWLSALAPEHAAGYFEHAEQYEEIFKRDKIAEELESDLIDSDDENGQN
ncbi:unnamed protein product [Didymodactylos carnosus]|uniref:Uncharacterized protein n=1 Tax=Didymodactylos carnosus TaxID=1234261 RepID=A0A815Q2P7_9BILA|nr:unnamed protein product [Didymodactylos carnosus]CAF4328900.1 unnamed protein product [Didymodactylos carnosus]